MHEYSWRFSLICFFHLHMTIQQKYMTFFLSFILSLCTTIRPKIRVLINLMFLFVHDHSTRGHSYSSIYSFLDCANTLFAVLPLYFVSYNHTLIFRTLYSWKCCSCFSCAISMAKWSLCRNSRTPRNSDESIVDPGIPTKHQCNTNGTPGNNGSI